MLFYDPRERGLVQPLGTNTLQNAVVEIYKYPHVNESLRDLAVKITSNHITELKTSNEAAHSALPNSLVKSVPQSTSDLLVATVDKTDIDGNQHGVCRKGWARERDRSWSY